jgi:hypothetical protein
MANAVTIKTINDFMIDLKPASSFSIRTEPYLQNIKQQQALQFASNIEAIAALE